MKAERMSFGPTAASPSSSYSTAKSHSVVLAHPCAYTHAQGRYSSVWNGKSSHSYAFVVKICQKNPAEALIMAGQQSVIHYWDSIELNAVWLNLSQYCKTHPAFIVYTQNLSISHVSLPQQ